LQFDDSGSKVDAPKLPFVQGYDGVGEVDAVDA
jgi:NADPH:quinone reductase-like Zn-dependent oxidoreductase